MKIWILEIGEPLPIEPNVRLHRYGLFSRALAEMGHQVVWWTSSFSHAPKKHFADKDQDLLIDKVTLRILRGLGYPRNVSLARIRHNKHFAARFAKVARTHTPPDLILAPIPIIEAAREAVRYGQEFSCPVLTDIRDLWPEELRDRAPKPLRWLARLLLTNAYQQMSYVCQNAHAIMGISHTYLEYGLKFAGRARTQDDLFFPLGYSKKALSPESLAQARAWRQEQAFANAPFVVCFFGTIGKFFDLETVIEAARRLPEMHFVLAGAGSELERFQRQAQGLANVSFPGWLDGPQIQAVMEIAKVGLAPYRKDANMALPNKPFEYMAGGLPLLSSISKELPELLKRHHCGRSYQADDIEDLIHNLKWFQSHIDERVQMGVNAERLLADEFVTEKVFAHIENELQRIVREAQR